MGSFFRIAESGGWRGKWVRLASAGQGEFGSFFEFLTGGGWYGRWVRLASAVVRQVGSFGEGRVWRRGAEMYANELGIEWMCPA